MQCLWGVNEESLRRYWEGDDRPSWMTSHPVGHFVWPISVRHLGWRNIRSAILEWWHSAWLLRNAVALLFFSPSSFLKNGGKIKTSTSTLSGGKKGGKIYYHHYRVLYVRSLRSHWDGDEEAWGGTEEAMSSSRLFFQHLRLWINSHSCRKTHIWLSMLDDVKSGGNPLKSKLYTYTHPVDYLENGGKIYTSSSSLSVKKWRENLGLPYPLLYVRYLRT